MLPGQENQLRPSIELNQGVVVGITQTDSLERPIHAFLGIPYALPPTGDRRFRPPVKLEPSSQVIDAHRYGPAAPGKPLLITGPNVEYSEDCLTVNVFRQVLPPTPAYPLPVAIYVHGGAFNRGTASMHNTASMVAASEQPFIAVSFNYRIGALGFLPSRLSQQEGVLNLGLKDQILLFEWVQENIERFGGDKSDVTLIGLSAGAHSIGHHLMRHNASNPGPFHRVVMESGAPTSRAVREPQAEIYEQQFSEFLREAGCPVETSDQEVFPFLRSLPIATIERAQNAVFDQYNPSLRWAFQPVIDGETILRRPIDTWRSGNYYKVPIMTGFNGNEGSLYVDKQMSTVDAFRHFFHTLLPLLPCKDLDTITNTLYPDPESSGDFTYQEHRMGTPGIGNQYTRIEAAYGQYAYVAPVRQTAHYAAQSQSDPVYLYHWALLTTVEGGASHGDNLAYETYNAQVCARGQSQRELSGTLHAYVTSFICNKGDPNAIAGRYAHRPKWDPCRPGQPLRTMIFGRGNRELVDGLSDDATPRPKPAEMIDDAWAQEQCAFWWDRVELTQE